MDSYPADGNLYFFTLQSNMTLFSSPRITVSQPPRSPWLSNSHAFFQFTLPLVLNLLGLKYQARETNPFEAHPNIMFLASASTLLYCISYATKNSISLAIFGSISVASLFSLVFSRWWMRHCLISLCLAVFFSFSTLPYPLTVLFQRLMDEFARFNHRRRCRRRDIIHLLLSWITHGTCSHQPNLLPL